MGLNLVEVFSFVALRTDQLEVREVGGLHVPTKHERREIRDIV
jgi:hypothetical protein